MAPSAHAVDSAVQFSGKAREVFWTYNAGENAEGAISVFGNINWTVNTGSVLVFGYAGPEWTFYDTVRLRLYGGVMATGGGTTNVTASLWLESLRLGIDGLGLCLQFDTYFPQHNKKSDGSERISFYGQLALSMKTGQDVTFSLFAETVADTEDVYELAIGPLVRKKAVGFWVGFDLTPNLPDSWRILTRLNFYWN